jgi:hypothetical protein
VYPVAGGEVEYVNLFDTLDMFGATGGGRESRPVTVSLLVVFGTATNNSLSMAAPSDGAAGTHWAKEQKFMVFTMRICSSHGCLRGSGGISTGRTTLIPGSSSSGNFQTISL